MSTLYLKQSFLYNGVSFHIKKNTIQHFTVKDLAPVARSYHKNFFYNVINLFQVLGMIKM